MIDNKQRLLIAFYIEYQKDKSNYDAINSEIMKVDSGIFHQCMEKLEKEGLIKFELCEKKGMYHEPTLQGIAYIERLFKISDLLPNIIKLEHVGYELQVVEDSSLIDYTKNAIIEIDSRYEEYFKTHTFANKN